MELPKALEILHEYWPDTKGLMWGEALETVCTKAVEAVNSPSIGGLRVLRDMIRTQSTFVALEVIDGMIKRLEEGSCGKI